MLEALCASALIMMIITRPSVSLGICGRLYGGYLPTRAMLVCLPFWLCGLAITHYNSGLFFNFS